METQPTYLVRIKPTSKRETQVVDGLSFEKRRQWYGPIGAELAERLRALPENDLNPAVSPKIFDVLLVEQARATEQAEQAKEEPAGTVAAPVEPPAAPPTPEAAPSKPKRPRRRRGG